MPLFFLYLLLITLSLQSYTAEPLPIVLKTKRIQFDNFPEGFNPSLLKIENGYLLSFREVPKYYEDWISYICIVLLDDQFEPISQPQRLETRHVDSTTPSQSEDARLFTYQGKIYLIYNDNIHITRPNIYARREMFIAELFYSDGLFSLSSPLQLYYEDKRSILWQKNWIPFEWNEMLLLGYSISPHEVLFANLKNGECYFGYSSNSSPKWDFGHLRGGTPACLDDDEYLAFFHSGMVGASAASNNYYLWHYFMGAYTFAKEPPFHITSFSPEPIITEGFYTHSSAVKRVIYPSGVVVDDPYIYVAYGKDDQEIWIATLDKKALKASLIPVMATP